MTIHGTGRRLMVLILGLLALVLAACDDPEPVTLGAVLPLSGPVASVGADIRDGLQLAVDEVNAGGGLNGRPLELVLRDAGTDADSARAAYADLAATGPLLIMSGTSGVSMAIKPEVGPAAPFTVALVATAPDVTAPPHPLYRYWPTADQEAPPMGGFLPASLKDLAVVYVDDPYGRSVAANIHDRMAERGIQVHDRPFPLAGADYDAVAEAVMAMEAVVVVGLAHHIRGVLGALAARDYPGRRVSTTTATLPDVVADPAAEGTYVVAPAIYNDNFGFADAVRQRYEARFDKPFNQYAANGYDFVTLVRGLLEGGQISDRALRDRFARGFVYSGVFGNIALETGQRTIDFPLFPARIIDGRLIYR